MLYALDSTGNQVRAEKTSQEAKCPYCGNRVISKCGTINIHHWAHEVDCIYKDSWNYEPMSQWHLDWQELFTNTQREAYTEKDGVAHRADILTNNKVVIEVQNSTISSQEIWRRVAFYDKLIWIINGQSFKHNLLFRHDLFLRSQFFLNRFWEHEDINGIPHLIVHVPTYDKLDYLSTTLSNCGYKYWIHGKWIKPKERAYKVCLDKEIVNAILSIEMDKSIEDYYKEYKRVPLKNRQSIFFKWKHFHSCWEDVLGYGCHIFIDLNNSYLLKVDTLYKDGKCYGKFIPKEQFIKKYNEAKAL